MNSGWYDFLGDGKTLNYFNGHFGVAKMMQKNWQNNFEDDSARNQWLTMV